MNPPGPFELSFIHGWAVFDIPTGFQFILDMVRVNPSFLLIILFRSNTFSIELIQHSEQ